MTSSGSQGLLMVHVVRNIYVSKLFIYFKDCCSTLKIYLLSIQIKIAEEMTWSVIIGREGHNAMAQHHVRP